MSVLKIALATVAATLTAAAAAAWPAMAGGTGPACSLSGEFAFGLIDPTASAPMTGMGTLSLSCNGGDPGMHVTVCMLPLARPLHLSAGAAAIAFELYTDPARQKVFAPQGQGQALAEVDLDIHGSVQWKGSVYGIVTTPGAEVPAGHYAAAPILNWRIASGTGCGSGIEGTGKLAVSAEAVKRCTVLASQDVDFGTLDVTAHTWTATGALDVTCTRGVAYTIELGGGSSGRPEARTMRKGADVLPYGLYTDAGFSKPWTTASTKGGTGTGAADRHPVFGRILAITLPRSGDYSDEVIVTVRY